MENILSCNEFCKVANITNDELKQYEDASLIMPAYDRENDVLFYTQSDLDKVEYIKYCQEVGMHYDEILSGFYQDLSVYDCDEKLEELECEKANIQRQINELKAYRAKKKANTKVLRLIPNKEIAA